MMVIRNFTSPLQLFLKYIGLVLLLFHCNCILAQPEYWEKKFSPEEIAWLTTHQDSIKYGPMKHYAPIDYVGSDNKHYGIVAEYVRIFEQKLGITFQKVNFNSWQEMIMALKNNELDFIGSIQKNEEREKYLNFTDSFIILPVAVLVKDDYPMLSSKKEINKMRLACVRSYASIEYVKTNYPGVQIREFDDDLTALLQTSLGHTDGTVMNLITASYFVEKYGITNLQMATLLDFKWQYRFGCAKGNPELCSILDKVLTDITPEERQKIYNKYVNINVITMNQQSGYGKVILITGSILLILIVLFLSINMALKKQIKKATSDLQLAKEKAEKSDKLKSVFLQNLSHEIRTPMNSILGFTDILKQMDLTSAEKNNYFNCIQNSGEYLVTLLNDIVEISKFDSGLIKIRYSTFNIHQIMEEIIQLFLVSKLRVKGVDVLKESNLIHEAGFIKSDVVKIKQIVNNILTNALKNTDAGSVTLSYNIIEGDFLEITVKDTGRGISKEHHEVIFDRFRQVDVKMGNTQKGTGLGLSIVKAYVKLLSGTIHLESEPGLGSLFVIKIPVEVIDEDVSYDDRI